MKIQGKVLIICLYFFAVLYRLINFCYMIRRNSIVVVSIYQYFVKHENECIANNGK